MFYYTLAFLSTASLYFLKPYLTHNCRKLNSYKNNAYNLTKNYTIYELIKEAVVIVCKLIWLTLLQRINNSVTKIDKNRYMVEFCIKGKWYKQIFATTAGPSSIVQIIDENEDDVTTEVEPYINSLKATSGDINLKYLNYKTLTFNMADGESKLLTVDDSLSTVNE